MEGADFGGWATKANLLCADGVTILPGAFKGQDGDQVTLVYQHGHKSPTEILGHAILMERDEGTYAYGFFNDTPAAQAAKAAVQHGDIKALSIYANELIKRGNNILHGKICELSLVIAGANPGAMIDAVTIEHSDWIEQVEGEAIIYTGDEIVLEHSADAAASTDAPASEGEKTIEQVVDTMDDLQQEAFYTVLDRLVKAEEKLGTADTGDSAQHSAIGDDAGTADDAQSTDDQETEDEEPTVDENGGDAGDDTNTNESQEGDTNMSKDSTLEHTNVFEPKDDETTAKHVLTKKSKDAIFHDAMRLGSMKDAVDAYCIQHGIDEIDILFPDARNLDQTPQFLKRRTEWVANFMDQCTKTPFSKIKNLWADITEDEARAKGYIKGNEKKEEFFNVAKRVTGPTTIYKKQKLDRDDILDITDFDVVAWLKMEMRVMLDEEIARAALVGDGRDVTSPDKIKEDCIRPIAKDNEFFTSVVNVNISGSVQAFIDAVVKGRVMYKGTGQPTMYTTESVISAFLLLKDTLGRDLYRSVEEVASKLRVREIVAVEIMEEYDDIIAVLVNPMDYTFGANRGGEVTMFDQFDIDFNQQKYLIETRCCGALTKLKSAIVFRNAGDDTFITATAPTFDPATSKVTVPLQANVTFKNDADGSTISNSTITLDPGERLKVIAVAADGYYFATSDDDEWVFTGVTV
jgi:HK97 family phage prohead protease